MADNIKDDAKEKILETTVELIGKEGIQSVTVRKVAELCSVNVASINYHFGSKDNLIKQAIKYFSNMRIFEIFDILNNKELTIEERLYQFLKNYTSILTKYPGFPKSIIGSLLSDDFSLFGNIENLLKQGMSKIGQLIGEYHKIDDVEICKMKTAQLIVPILFPLAMNPIFSDIFSMDLHDEKTIDNYINVILQGSLFLDKDKVDIKKEDTK